jgi:ankyrin repeat protein
MATLWHVGDLIELICEFDDSPIHLTTLRRVSWSFHRAVENVWTLLLGRQNCEIGDEHVQSIRRRYVAQLHSTGQDEAAVVPALRAALTALQHTVTSVAWPWRWQEQSMSKLSAQLTDMPRLQSAKFQGRESLVYIIARLGTADRLEALLHRCPHLVGVSSSVYSFALHCTARSGNLGCALVLLRHGCDPNVRNSLTGRTIAHFACERGHHEYLVGIINAGYDVDLSATSRLFWTPAHATVLHPSTLQFLIDRGASVNDAALGKGTPATRAASAGATESLRILLAAGATVPPGLAAWDHPACLDVLGDAGADLDAVNHLGDTAAHRAAREGQLESLRTLHKQGANMFALSRAEETPEQLATRSGFTECVEFLAELRVSNPPGHLNRNNAEPNATHRR